MLGSATQNIIVLSDNVFLYHVSNKDFAAVGLVGVFYLIVTAIGFGFSRGGQILIARKNGERDYEGVGAEFQALLIFEVAMAVAMFLFLHLGSEWLFRHLVSNPEIYERCLEYLYPRSFGVLFSYVGMTIIALYTGIARTTFIVIDTIVLAVVNIVLNYTLIYGAFGFEPMGIAGAGWASTIAEIVAFILFVIYMIFDKRIHTMHLLRFQRIDIQKVVDTFKISMPIVLQSMLSLGSWFVFFTMIENRSAKDLEISNLLRNVYLILSIPAWGYSSGINTIVSSFIGNRKRQAVKPLIYRTTLLNLGSTLLLSIPVLIFPKFFLYPLFGSSEVTLIDDAIPVFWILGFILVIFAIGTTYINGVLGTGHTRKALYYQTLGTITYLGSAYYAINVANLNLDIIWSSEIVYWIVVLGLSYYFLRSNKWHNAPH